MIDPSVHIVGEGIHKDIQYPGKGPLPNYQKDTKAVFHFRTYINDNEKTLLDDSRIWDEPFELILGHEFQLVAWELAVRSMRPGERARFTCSNEKSIGYAKLSKTLRDIQKQKIDKDFVARKSCCGSQSTGYADLDNITGASLIFEFDMLTVQQPGEYKKEVWTMNDEEKYSTVADLREKGNQFFKQSNHESAGKCYAKAVGILEQLGLKEQPNSEEWNKIEDLKVPLLLNYSQVKLNQEEFVEALRHLNTVLKQDPANPKGLYRRAIANGGCWNVEESISDWRKLAEVTPSYESLAERKIQELKNTVKKKEDEEKTRLKGMF